MDKGNVTILIPTANRADFLIRQLSYYARQDSPYPVVIADSSEKILLIPAWLHDKLDLTHLILAKLGISSAIRSANRHIRTKYVVYSGDDDFVIPSGIGACADFLDTNPDYSAAHGIGWAMRILGAYGKPEWVVYYDYGQPVIEEDTPLLRLTNHIRNYNTTIFSVTRSEVWIRAFPEICETRLDQVFGDEVLPSCLIAVLGKVAWLPVPHLVHQDHPARCWGARGYEWLITPNWVRWYSVFANHLASAILRKDGTFRRVSLKEIDSAYNCYMSRYWGRFWKDYTTRHGVMAVLRNLLRRMPLAVPAWLKLWKLWTKPRPVDDPQVFIPKKVEEIIAYCKHGEGEVPPRLSHMNDILNRNE